MSVFCYYGRLFSRGELLKKHENLQHNGSAFPKQFSLCWKRTEGGVYCLKTCRPAECLVGFRTSRYDFCQTAARFRILSLDEEKANNSFITPLSAVACQFRTFQLHLRDSHGTKCVQVSDFFPSDCSAPCRRPMLVAQVAATYRQRSCLVLSLIAASSRFKPSKVT